jgi:hypothetical protein
MPQNRRFAATFALYALSARMAEVPEQDPAIGQTSKKSRGIPAATFSPYRHR